MSRRRQPNTKHGRKRPDSIAPSDDQSVGQNDASVPGVSPVEDGSVAVARRSDERLNEREHEESPDAPALSSSSAPDRRPKTPPAIDPDAPTSVLPVSELPARADGSRNSGSAAHVGP